MTDWLKARNETELGPKFRIYKVGFFLRNWCGGVRLEDNNIITHGEYAARFFERGLFYDWNWEYRALDDPWVQKVGVARCPK